MVRSRPNSNQNHSTGMRATLSSERITAGFEYWAGPVDLVGAKRFGLV